MLLQIKLTFIIAQKSLLLSKAYVTFSTGYGDDEPGDTAKST